MARIVSSLARCNDLRDSHPFHLNFGGRVSCGVRGEEGGGGMGTDQTVMGFHSNDEAFKVRLLSSSVRWN